MQNTHLLLENLADREKATVETILDSLYDVGTVRLINQKVNINLLRRPLKGIARFSKPVFRLVAWRWFKRNSPELITRWLFSQVMFNDRALPAQQTPVDPIDIIPLADALPPILEQQATEILALRGRVTLLTAIVIVLAVLFGLTVLT